MAMTRADAAKILEVQATAHEASAQAMFTFDKYSSRQHTESMEACLSGAAALRVAALSVPDAPKTPPPPAVFTDTPVLSARRRAFDSPTIANLDALILTVRAERGQP